MTAIGEEKIGMPLSNKDDSGQVKIKFKEGTEVLYTARYTGTNLIEDGQSLNTNEVTSDCIGALKTSTSNGTKMWIHSQYPLASYISSYDVDTDVILRLVRYILGD